MALDKTLAGLLNQFISTLTNDELIEAGPDLSTFLGQVQATDDPAALYLDFNRLQTAIVADQLTVAHDIKNTYAGQLKTSLDAAIAAAKAKQGAPAPAAG